MLKEINFCGIYFAPFAVYLLIALLIFFPARWFMDRWNVGQWVWHRRFFDACVFVVILSLVGLLF